MEEDFCSSTEMLQFLIFLNTQLNEGSNTEFTIISGASKLWKKKYGSKLEGNFYSFLNLLSKKEVLTYKSFGLNMKSHTFEVIDNKDFITKYSKFKFIGTLDFDNYQSYVVHMIITAENGIKQATKTIEKAQAGIEKAQAGIDKANKYLDKVEEEKIKLLGFSPLENSKKIQKTKKDVQDFLKIAKENKTLIGFVDEVTELIKNIDSIENINDNYIDVFNNIIKPMKDETDKSIKEITFQSKKGTAESIKAINAQSLKGTIFTVVVAILSIVITFIMQN